MLPEVSGQLRKYLGVWRDLEMLEDSLAGAHQQMLLVKEAEAMGVVHPLYSLPNRCALLLKARSAHATLAATLKEKRDEYDKDIINYKVRSSFSTRCFHGGRKSISISECSAVLYTKRNSGF